jgi:dolichol-phosphate mannosyltransferase
MPEQSASHLYRDYQVPPGQLLHEGVARPEVSIVVPVYWNSETLEALYERIAKVMDKTEVATWDVTFVDDGSGDNSREVLERIRSSHANVRVVHLAKNHGSTPAILTGMGLATGRAVAVLAADLQDPPETLEELIGIWRTGTKVAIATRISREDPLSSRIFSAIYYRLFRWLVSPEMPPGGFDIAVLDQQVSSLMVRYAEKNTNFPAALLSLGFQRKIIGYHRMAREHGSSRWTFWRKFKLMYDSILSYSYRPIRLVTVAGVVGIIFAMSYGAWVVYYRLTSPAEAPGWASLMVVTLFFNGLVLTALGVTGEYIWRVFDAARKAPLVVVDRYVDPTATAARVSDEPALKPADPRPPAPGIPRKDSASPPQA